MIAGAIPSVPDVSLVKRRWFTVGGGTAVGIGLTVSVGLREYLFATPPFALWAGTFLVAGVLGVLGGEGRSVDGLGWYQLIGLGYVAFGLGTTAWITWGALAHGGPPTSLAQTGGLGFSGLFTTALGVLWLWSDGFVDPDDLEPGPIFRSGEK